MIELFADIVSGFQSLIHSFPMHSFSTPRKPRVFRDQRKSALGTNGLTIFIKNLNHRRLTGSNEHLELFKDDMFNVQFQQPYYFKARAFCGLKISRFRAEFREKYFLSSTAELKCCKKKFLAQNAKLKCAKKSLKAHLGK